MVASGRGSRSGKLACALGLAGTLALGAIAPAMAQDPSGSAPAVHSNPEVAAGKARIQAVYDEVAGLTGEERRAKLVEMALAEGGEVAFYGSLQPEQSGPILVDFENLTGVETIHYRAGGNTVATKILEEVDAGFTGADVVAINAAEIILLDDAGILASLASEPLRETLLESTRFENWLGVYLNAFVYSWNTDLVDASTLPGTHEGMLADFQGTMAFDIDNYDWFFALTNDYLIGELGWTQEQAVEALKARMAKSRLSSGTTLTLQLLAAGEFDLSPTGYASTINQMSADGAPVGWYPGQPEPVFVRPNGIGIVANTTRPASAILLLEYFLSDAQETLATRFGRTPASVEVSSGGIPEELDTRMVDIEAFAEKEDEYRALWDEIVDAAGG